MLVLVGVRKSALKTILHPSTIHTQRSESELTSLKAQLSTTLSPSRAETESRLHELTESLIHKQTTLETLSAERNSLNLQLQRVQVYVVPGICILCLCDVYTVTMLLFPLHCIKSLYPPPPPHTQEQLTEAQTSRPTSNHTAVLMSPAGHTDSHREGER